MDSHTAYLLHVMCQSQWEKLRHQIGFFFLEIDWIFLLTVEKKLSEVTFLLVLDHGDMLHQLQLFSPWILFTTLLCHFYTGKSYDTHLCELYAHRCSQDKHDIFFLFIKSLLAFYPLTSLHYFNTGNHRTRSHHVKGATYFLRPLLDPVLIIVHLQSGTACIKKPKIAF